MKNRPVKIIVAILIALLATSSILYGYLGIKYQDNITQAIRSVFISEKTEPDSNGFYYSKPAPATFVSLSGSAATPILTPTSSPSVSPSITLSPSSTPSNTPTMTVSPTVTLPITTIPITSTPLPTITATPRVTITPTTTPTPTATPTPTPTPSPKYHVQYYGYYFTNDYASQQSSANTGFVNMDCSAFPDVSRTAQLHISKINTLQSFKLKAIVDLFPILFDCSKTTLTLMPDWQARWNSYLSIMKPYQSKILAFYPIDEPDIHASNSDFTKIADYMRSTMNNQGVNTPILAVFSFLAVPKIRDGQYTIPSSVNWVSFDEYNCWGNECYGGLSITQKMNILLQKVKPWGGKVFLIPDGVEFSTAVPSYSRQQQWVTRADLFYNLCRQTEDCIGLLPFVWDPPTYANMVGIKKMDLVKQKFDAIGTDLLINAR